MSNGLKDFVKVHIHYANIRHPSNHVPSHYFEDENPLPITHPHPLTCTQPFCDY